MVTGTTGTETIAVDLVSRILAVDLSKPRKTDYKPVGENDHVLGVISENLQRLDCLRVDLVLEGETLREILQGMITNHLKDHLRDDGHDCGAFHEELQRVGEELHAVTLECKTIDEIFWLMVYLEFPKTVDKNYFIREGRQIVWNDEDEEKNQLAKDIIEFVVQQSLRRE